MADHGKQPMQAVPEKDDAKMSGDVETGRKGGGESGGGAFKDKDQVKGDPDNDGFDHQHGGQSHIDYSGPDNPNATAGS